MRRRPDLRPSPRHKAIDHAVLPPRESAVTMLHVLKLDNGHKKIARRITDGIRRRHHEEKSQLTQDYADARKKMDADQRAQKQHVEVYSRAKSPKMEAEHEKASKDLNREYSEKRKKMTERHRLEIDRASGS